MWGVTLMVNAIPTIVAVGPMGIAGPGPSNDWWNYALWLWPLDWFVFRLHSLNDFIEVSGEFGLLQPLLDV